MIQFIQLPDGGIINVAHVRSVSRPISIDFVRIHVGQTTDEDLDALFDFHDPHGKIYAWFAERAVEVGGE